MASSEYIIRTENLSKEYVRIRGFADLILRPFKQESILILDGINLTFKRAEFIYLLGLNGAGKTTLIKILCGLLLPTTGRIYLDGKIVSNPYELKERVGFASGDERSFYWRLTARENLEFFGTLYGVVPKKLGERLKELFSLFEIDDPNRRFYEYPSGFKQRLSIVRALLHDPDILFLDEPTKNLDYLTREKLLSFIKEKLIKENGKTVVMSGSNLRDAKDYDKLILLDKGKIKI